MSALREESDLNHCNISRDGSSRSAVDIARPRARGLPQLVGGPDSPPSQRSSQTPHEISVILYVDPQALTRDCIGRWLGETLGDFEVTSVESPTALDARPPAGEPDAVLINGRSCQGDLPIIVAEAAHRWPDAPIMLLADDDAADSVLKAFDLGIRGYIPTTLTSEVVLAAVRLVCTGGTFVPSAALVPATKKACHPRQPCRAVQPHDQAVGSFTERQAQILECLRRGMANKHIAYELDMRESTVKVHIRNIMKKLKATNRTQVVYLTRPLFEGTE